MIKLPHSIRKQTIEVDVDSEAVALALQPRLADINRRYFLPVIERVMDEIAVSGKRLKVARVDVDLGVLPFGGFETSAAQRLYRELKSALETALREQEAGVSPGDRGQPEQSPLLEMLEPYLVSGALPSWAPRGSRFSLEELIDEAINEDPSSVANVIRRHGGETHVLERLVLQLDEPLLERLIHLLKPEHAALIIAYLIDLQKVHSAEPIVALSDREFSRLLWVLALSYLVQDPGSHFNRRSFVRSLLERMAQSEGVRYEDLLMTLLRGLEKTGRRISLKSSLPGVISELVIETGNGEFPANEFDDGQDRIHLPDDERPAHELRYGPRDAGILDDAENDRAGLMRTTADHVSGRHIESAATNAENHRDGLMRMNLGDASRGDEIETTATEAESEMDRVIRMIRDHASRSGEIERVVTEADEAYLRELLERLDPANTALIVAYMTDLREIHQVERVPAVSDWYFDRLLWILVLTYEARDPGSQFNRMSFVKSLLEGIAESEGLEYRELVRAMRLGLEKTQKKGWIKSSLPAVIGQLLGGLDEESRGLEPEQGGGSRPPPGRLTQSAASPYDQFEIVRYYLTHGTLPWSSLLDRPALTAKTAVTPLLTLSASQLRSLFSQQSGDDRQFAALRAVEALGEEAVRLLIARLLNHTGAPSGPFFDGLSHFAQQAQDKHDFYARTIAVILEGRSVDFESMITFRSGRSSSDPGLAGAVLDWPPHLLKSVIAAHLRHADSTAPGAPPLGDLIHALVVRRPQDARHFFYEIDDVQALSNALVDQCHPSLFENVLELLRPAEVEAVNALMRAVASIPAPYRPASDETVSRAVFLELISLGPQQPLSDAFFLRVIRRLFTAPLAEPVSKCLLREAAAWEGGDLSLAEHASAFEDAIRAAGVRANGGSHEKHHDAQEIQSASVQRASALIDAIFDFLAGKTIESEDRADRSYQSRAARDAISSDALLHALLVLLDQSPETVSSFIAREVVDRRTRDRWVRILPESVLVRISYLLAPWRHRVLMQSAEVLASAWIEAAPAGHPRLTDREELWLFLLESFSKGHGAALSLKRLVIALSNHYAARYQAASPSAVDRAAVAAKLFERAGQLAAASGRTSLLAVLQDDRAALLESWSDGAAAAKSEAASRALKQRVADPRPSRSSSSRLKTRFNLMKDDADRPNGDPIYISNAGLVLANPFLPHFFRSLNLIEEQENGRPRLRDGQAISRASHLLQYLVDGCTSSPEPLLVLNKILCGAPVSAPIESKIDPTVEEIELCDRLLKSMISNWKIIQNSSVAALRETFLQREGKLECLDDAWKLRVQRKTVDVLVDQVPWNVSVVYHQWMSKPIHVTW